MWRGFMGIVPLHIVPEINCVTNVTPWIEFCMAAGPSAIHVMCSAAIIGSAEITLVP